MMHMREGVQQALIDYIVFAIILCLLWSIFFSRDVSIAIKLLNSVILGVFVGVWFL